MAATVLVSVWVRLRGTFKRRVLVVHRLIDQRLAFTRLALDGVRLRGKAVYAHDCMLGSDNGNLAALAEVSKYALMAQERFAPINRVTAEL